MFGGCFVSFEKFHVDMCIKLSELSGPLPKLAIIVGRRKEKASHSCITRSSCCTYAIYIYQNLDETHMCGAHFARSMLILQKVNKLRFFRIIKFAKNKSKKTSIDMKRTAKGIYLGKVASL